MINVLVRLIVEDEWEGKGEGVRSRTWVCFLYGDWSSWIFISPQGSSVLHFVFGAAKYTANLDNNHLSRPALWNNRFFFRRFYKRHKIQLDFEFIAKAVIVRCKGVSLIEIFWNFVGVLYNNGPISSHDIHSLNVLKSHSWRLWSIASKGNSFLFASLVWIKPLSDRNRKVTDYRLGLHLSSCLESGNTLCL